LSVESREPLITHVSQLSTLNARLACSLLVW
jgi:hypothetical protein